MSAIYDDDNTPPPAAPYSSILDPLPYYPPLLLF